MVRPMAATPRKAVVIHLRVRVAWWLPCYLMIVSTLCDLLDRAPDMDRVERVMRRGTRVAGIMVNEQDA